MYIYTYIDIERERESWGPVEQVHRLGVDPESQDACVHMYIYIYIHMYAYIV